MSLHHINHEEKLGGKARCELLKDIVCCFEQILEAAPYKKSGCTATYLLSCNNPSKMSKTCLNRWRWNDELIREVLLWTLKYRELSKSNGRYRGMVREREREGEERERSVKGICTAGMPWVYIYMYIYKYIYIYIYINWKNQRWCVWCYTDFAAHRRWTFHRYNVRIWKECFPIVKIPS